MLLHVQILGEMGITHNQNFNAYFKVIEQFTRTTDRNTLNFGEIL